ncbi:unnamed protein product [Effrenium voratum]|nr:unnamed protein product [Effrenium voratum]
MCTLCARHRCLCGGLAAFLGTVCIFGAACATSIYVRLTPLYSTIECRHGSTQMQNLHVGVPLISATSFDLIIEMKCQNPNPYSIGFEWTEPGTVYIGRSMTEVGHTQDVPGKENYFPADGNGSTWVKANTTINAKLLSSLAGDLLFSGGQLPLRLELRQRLEVDVMLLFGGGAQVAQDFVKDCGMMIGNLGPNPKIGPMACANTFDELVIPPVSGGSSDGVMRLEAKMVAPKKIQQGMDLKNWGLGLTMAVFYTLGLVLYVVAGCLFWRHAKDASAKREELEASSNVTMELDSEQSVGFE